MAKAASLATTTIRAVLAEMPIDVLNKTIDEIAAILKKDSKVKDAMKKTPVQDSTVKVLVSAEKAKRGLVKTRAKKAAVASSGASGGGMDGQAALKLLAKVKAEGIDLTALSELQAKLDHVAGVSLPELVEAMDEAFKMKEVIRQQQELLDGLFS